MPLTDAALNDEVLTVDVRSGRAPDFGHAAEFVPADASGPAQAYSNARCVAEASMAFIAVFLVSGFFAGTVRGDGWAGSLASAAVLGVAGAGVQLLLMAVRARRELEAGAES